MEQRVEDMSNLINITSESEGQECVRHTWQKESWRCSGRRRLGDLRSVNFFVCTCKHTRDRTPDSVGGEAGVCGFFAHIYFLRYLQKIYNNMYESPPVKDTELHM